VNESARDIVLVPATRRDIDRSSSHPEGATPLRFVAQMVEREISMLRNGKILALLGALGASSVVATSAQAGSILGLVEGKWVVTIDPGTRKVAKGVDIKGAGRLIGIDVRPADGLLYGVTVDGWVVAIDPQSGQASRKSKLSETLKAGVTATVDFNPVADRLRIMGSDGTSLRVNVDDGKAIVDGTHKFKEGDVNAGKTPKIVAGAYSNAVKGTPSTMLYDIDVTTGSLVTQAPPNDGILNTVGPLGVKLEGAVGFNIVTSGPDQNEAWLTGGGVLYSVDLKTGKASMVGKFTGLPGYLTDIAWMD
jgi:hypothetical protein